ncbi:MAG: hypothetical protein GEU93_16850 [Propionibacteriales bacterium]|nr:hypothetical protein [Propionibacteriales bacterium]
MRKYIRWSVAAIASGVLVAAALPAQADHGDFPSTRNVRALGHSPHPASFAVPAAERQVNSDIAFWGNLAIHGNYNGFRIVDISSPARPRLISHPRCNGDQGDVVVWDNIVVRSWNSPAPEEVRTCMGEPVPVGFEGVHVFDISDPANPQLVTEVEFSEEGAATRGTADGCGSHTQTLVPDLDNNRVVIYSNNSSGGGREVCDAMNIIEVPLDDPSQASHIGYVPLMDGTLGSTNGCHDAGAILGDANLLACASGHAANVFSIGEPRGGSLEEPRFLFSVEEEEILDDGSLVKVGAPAAPGQFENHSGRWHSAGFSWDGEVLILGWEPGGGGQAECTADDANINKTMFFYDTTDGRKLGQWTLPRAQGHDENCTIHNYNTVPLRGGQDVVVSGNYQAGTWAVDFTDRGTPQEFAWADPESLGPGPFCDPDGNDNPMPPTCQLGGAWSSYWYNGVVYESDISRGLNLYRVADQAVRGAIKLPHLNPQTQEFVR